MSTSFFCSASDSEDEPIDYHPADIQKAVTPVGQTHSAHSGSSRRSRGPQLFLDADSDDERIENLKRKAADDSDKEYADIQELDSPPPPPKPRSSSPSHIPRSSSVISIPDDSPHVKKKRKVSKSLEPIVLPKSPRKVTEAREPLAEPHFLGEFIVPNAWSTVSGNTYIKAGDRITIEREDPAPPPKPAPSKNTTKSGDGKRQTTLKAMFKPPPAKKVGKKKPDNTVVRLVNPRGTGMYCGHHKLAILTSMKPSRVSHRNMLHGCPSYLIIVSSITRFHWTILSHPPQDMVEIRGIVVDVPTKVMTGVDIIVTLQVFILPSAFKTPDNSGSDNGQSFFFQEGTETIDETVLRHRKDSIIKLFKKLGLKPVAGASLDGVKPKKRLADALNQRKPPSNQGKGKENALEIHDPEEEEEGEELEATVVENIYSK